MSTLCLIKAYGKDGMMLHLYAYPFSRYSRLDLCKFLGSYSIVHCLLLVIMLSYNCLSRSFTFHVSIGGSIDLEAWIEADPWASYCSLSAYGSFVVIFWKSIGSPCCGKFGSYTADITCALTKFSICTLKALVSSPVFASLPIKEVTIISLCRPPSLASLSSLQSSQVKLDQLL